jgi:hypothetical protein
MKNILGISVYHILQNVLHHNITFYLYEVFVWRILIKNTFYRILYSTYLHLKFINFTLKICNSLVQNTTGGRIYHYENRKNIFEIKLFFYTYKIKINF